MNEIRETLSGTMVNHLSAFHILDSLIVEHGCFKHDIGLIKVFMEECKRETHARKRCDQESEDEEAIVKHEERRKFSREDTRP